MKWIKCSERLPETGANNLVCIKYIRPSRIAGQRYIGVLGFLLPDGKTDKYHAAWKYEQVTHWMPLPELPEDE